MPPVHVTLTETEWQHIHELVKDDSASWRLVPIDDFAGFAPIIVKLNDGILKKFDDASKAPTLGRLKAAADKADWGQVAANHLYGPPCFHYEPEHGCLCLRAKTWFGHDEHHTYVSLTDLLEAVNGLDQHTHRWVQRIDENDIGYTECDECGHRKGE